VLFIVGSACFAVGPFPGFVQLVGADRRRGGVLRGSLFFTSAATLQCIGGRLGPRGLDWWAAVVQLVGTVFFNISTSRRAAGQPLDRAGEPPDLGARRVRMRLLPRGERPRVGGGARLRRWINLAGSVAFGIAGVASFFVPDTGDVLDLAAANFTTVIGALCFLAGAVGMLAEERRARIPA
jgi:hypothetical protein